jgi:glyoxylase-like metal-dependent hydrolase (beta-lactamase superfamily II)
VRLSVTTHSEHFCVKGMSRFEGIANKPPPQPPVEYISDRVISILGFNDQSSFTLNGTNCYLVGTGTERILIDTAGGSGTPEQFDTFLIHLDRTLVAQKCRICLILVTHLHTDHYGGCERLQEIYGPGIPVGMIPTPAGEVIPLTLIMLFLMYFFSSITPLSMTQYLHSKLESLQKCRWLRDKGTFS